MDGTHWLPWTDSRSMDGAKAAMDGQPSHGWDALAAMDGQPLHGRSIKAAMDGQPCHGWHALAARDGKHPHPLRREAHQPIELHPRGETHSAEPPYSSTHRSTHTCTPLTFRTGRTLKRTMRKATHAIACYNNYMALNSTLTATKSTSSKKLSTKAKPLGTMNSTFTVQEAYIYELLNNKLDIVRKEAELNYESLRSEMASNQKALKAEIASNREELKAEIASNRELFLAHLKGIDNQFKTMRWALGFILVFLFSIATKLFFF